MLAAMLLAVCLTLAACGGSSQPAATGTPTATATRAGAVVPVVMTNNRFAPRRLVARLGQAVRWTNRDGVAHTVASQDLRLSSEAIGPGETFTHRPRSAGSFEYFCTIHFGQTGRLVVR